MEFKEWKHVIESIVHFHIGIDVDELPDQDYYTHYISGISPHVIADIVLMNNTM